MIVIFVLLTYSQNKEWIKLGWSNEVTSMVLENELLWITSEDGIYLINANPGAKDSIEKNKIYILPDDDLLTSVAANNTGEVWLGTAGGKIFRYDGKNFHTFDNLYRKDNFIYCMAFDKNNHLWIGMEKGLLHYDGKDWYYYDENSGLPGKKGYKSGF